MTVTIENTNVDTALNIAELTTASLTGTGVFDVLLQTLRLHLDREFTSGRITGTAYATVYSQAITSFLQQAVGFCLSKTKLALELQQMQEQVVLLQKQQAKLNYEIEEIIQRVEVVVPNQMAQITAERLRIDQNTANLVLESTNITKQGVLLDAQVAHTTAQTSSITAQTAQITYTTSNVLPAQVALTTAQTAQTTAQTSQVTYTTANLIPKQVLQLQSQIDMADSQTDLYTQKIATELAQTTSTPASGSVMGVQNALMVKQTENYERDAEQKAARLMLDTVNVRFTAESTSVDFDTTNHLSDGDVGVVVQKLITGIGGTVIP